MTGRLSPEELDEYRTHCSGYYGIAVLFGHIDAIQADLDAAMPVLDAAVAEADAWDAAGAAGISQSEATNPSQAEMARMEAAQLDTREAAVKAKRRYLDELRDWRRRAGR